MNESLKKQCVCLLGHVGSHYARDEGSYYGVSWSNPGAPTLPCSNSICKNAVSTTTTFDNGCYQTSNGGRVWCTDAEGHLGGCTTYQNGERVFLSLFDWSIY